ncbi:hypothetical protein [Curvivirga sp.]|uniref:hypothetical protein n=1 Tax=Curvivirga sp. TaxID=2856848 RepID=UPI003B5B5E8F
MNTKLKILFTAVAMTLSVSVFTNTAQAKTKVYVLNCTEKKVDVKSFNAKDKVMAVAYNKKDVKSGNVKSFKCKGQGKGLCQITFKTAWTNFDKKYKAHAKVRDGDTLVVTDTRKAPGALQRGKVSTCPVANQNDNNVPIPGN